MNRQKVAIVHDWLIGGGAELVVEQLHHMFPDAPIYTSYATEQWRKRLNNKVITGYLQRWPFGKLRKFLPFFRARWFAKLDLTDFDLVISSSGNGEAKFVREDKSAIHICYCHSPTHFYWRHYDTYLKNPGFGVLDPIARLGLRILVGPLRKADYKAAQRVDYFIANSTHIQADIKKYYGRESEIIFPPVDTKRFENAPKQKRSGFVTTGRQVPNKRIDIIVQACTELNLPLTVIGNGPEHSKLVKLAGPTVTFKTDITDEQMPRELAGAEAYLFASFDDFGIAPVEALSAGTPVIAYKAGGALDYVVPGKTGLFFENQTTESLIKSLALFTNQSISDKDCVTMASEFSVEDFLTRMQDFIKQKG